MDLRTTEQTMSEELLASRMTLDGNLGFSFAIGSNLDLDLTGEIFAGEPFLVKEHADMFDLLVEIGAFKSKSDARKNWKKSDQNIEDGLSTFLVGSKKIPLFIWKKPAGFEE